MKYSEAISVDGLILTTVSRLDHSVDRPQLNDVEPDKIEVAIDPIGNAHLRVTTNGRVEHATLSPPFMIAWK